MKENPEITVLLSSHTDERGTDVYNLKLSQLRAQSAVDYIISKGVNPIRIIGTGYGKSQPIHKCPDPKDCSPEELRENRRTEIYIPGVLKGENVKQIKGDFNDSQSLNRRPKNTLTEEKNSTKTDSSNSNKISIKSTYYLILGSFPDREATSKLIRSLEKEGLNAVILEYKTYKRVALEYHSFSEANKALEYFHSKYLGAWILRKE